MDISKSEYLHHMELEEPEVASPVREVEIPIIVELPDHQGKTLDDFDGLSPVFYLTGDAGTGKTTLVRQHIQRDPTFGVMCATTGVAAVNLGAGVSTIHSLLGFGNTQGAEDAYNSGNMLRKLRLIAEQGFRWIIADEASMLHYKVLDYIVLALDDYNQTYEGKTPLGLMLTGDLAQLAPVPDKLIGPGGKYVVSAKGKDVNEPTPWLFKAECWPRFEASMLKLTEIRRQNDIEFIQGLSAARKGNGAKAVQYLKQAGVQFKMLLNNNFDGTTIMATNDEVDRFNNSCLLKVEGESFEIRSTRWCAKQYPPGEWKNIPERAKFKIGALVMILQNHQPGVGGGPKLYVNGDLGHVVGVVRGSQGSQLEEDDDLGFNPAFAKSDEVVAVEVELLRTGEKVFITKVTRPTYQLNEPDMDSLPVGAAKEKVRKDRVPGMTRRVWVLGELDYIPLRLAYATTVNKSQGLTLERVQINPKAWFFGNPQMVYVALSRCRSATGITVVGSEQLLAEKIKTDPVLARWM